MDSASYIFFKDDKEGVLVTLTGREAVKYHPIKKTTVIDKLVEIVVADDVEYVKWTKWVREHELYIVVK